MRIFFGRLFHETNTFAPGTTEPEHFARRRGTQVWKEAGTGSLTDEARRLAEANGWTLVPSFDFSASPGPVVSNHIVEAVLRHLEEDLPAATAEGLDGIFLLLHGAMVSESHDDVEGLLLERISGILGGRRIPVAVVLDLHANVSPTMADHANIIGAYRCNPHTDAVECGLRTLRFLVDAIRNETNYRTHLVRFPVLLPPAGTATAGQPMAGLLDIACRHESSRVPIISVCAGFAHADTPYTGLSFQFVAKPGADISAASEELRAFAARHASDGIPFEWPLDEAIRDALRQTEHPTLLVEPADNIGGGGPGDATWLLDAFVRHRLENAAVILAAPEAVAELEPVPVGGFAEITLGGKHPTLTGPAVTLRVRVLRRTDGTFEAEDRKSHFVSARGTRIEMGPSVLAQAHGLTLLLTSHPTAPMDLGQWRSLGVAPETLGFIGIKAAVAHRRAYDPIARRSYTVSTPGFCTSDLTALPYRKAGRPIFPLDPLSSVTNQPFLLS